MSYMKNRSLLQHLAAQKGYEDIVQFLIQKDAPVNVKGKVINFQTKPRVLCTVSVQVFLVLY